MTVWNKCTALLLTLCLLLGFAPMQVHAEGAADELTALAKSYNRPTALIVYSMDGTTLYSYQPNKVFSGASLIKLPYCYYVCRQLENGVRSLDETMTYTKSWYHAGSGIIYKGAYGEVYTIEQLLDYALRYSDNVAYDMLVYLFGIDDFNAMIDSWGFDVHIGQTYPRFPAMDAAFVCEAMRQMQLRSGDGGPWEIAWTALCESEKTYVRGVLGNEETPVAVKYGNVSTVWHEACYIDCDDPYIFIILSSATNMEPDVSYLEAAAALAGRIHDEYAESKQAQEDALPVLMGDLDGDGEVTALDATVLLIACADLGAGDDSGLTELQTAAADLNANGIPDAADAAMILIYAARRGAGEDISMEDFLKSQAA